MIRNDWNGREIVILVLILAAVLAYSLPTLTTKPRLFFDEGFVIEEARNFAEFGVLDTITAPNTFSGLPHIASSIGFSVTAPLAGVFKIFGFSIEAARAYALMWMMLFLVAAYLFSRRYFGKTEALLSVLLIATFPPFILNGRLVMGDIPGFALLTLSLLLVPRAIFPAGILLGLCLVSRPSVYMFAVLALIAQFAFQYRKAALRPLTLLLGGVALPTLAALLLYLPGPTSTAWWQSTYLFFKSPTFGEANSTLANVLSNFALFTHESTLLYFAGLIALIVLAYRIRGSLVWNRSIVFFAALYCLLGFLYFLRSPGWFKYLLPLQLFVFLFLPSSLKILSAWLLYYMPEVLRRFKPATFAVCGALVLVLIQTTQLLFFADIYAATDAQDAASYLEAEATDSSTVAFIHASQVAMFFPAERKYSFFVVNEDLAVGENPLEFPEGERATYLVMPRDDLSQFSSEFDEEHMRVLADHYSLAQSYGRFNIFKLK